MPPLVVPRTIGRFSQGSQPACCQASFAASSTSLAARSSRRRSRGFKRVAGKPAGKSTSAATLTLCRETSKRVTGRIATRPPRNPCALAFHPWPKAVIIPTPVMTTRGGELAWRGAGNNTMPLRAGDGRWDMGYGRGAPLFHLPSSIFHLRSRSVPKSNTTQPDDEFCAA